MAFQKSKYFRSQDTENKSRILPFGNPNTAGHRNFAKFQERPACWSWLLRKFSVFAVMGPDGCATCLQMATPASVARGGRQNTLPLGRCGACLPRRASVRRKGLETINDVGDVPGALRKPANALLAFGTKSLGLIRNAVSASADQTTPLSIMTGEYLKPSTAPARARTTPFYMGPVRISAISPTRWQALRSLKTRLSCLAY